ncbi:HlyD family efflux transporter periplasmic adaptor subunit [Patescibacteria group bacterium]|nr:HlyD family efflux transporter periplasmic adaptor subunit [Patescibacteria group bacterium]
MKKLGAIKNYLFKVSIKKKFIFLVIIIVLAILIRHTIVNSQSKETTYETAIATKGSLITAISASGSITAGNSTNVTTKVSGVVKKVYVTNGDTVKKGQKIADVELDDYAKERETIAWVNYLDALEAVKTAEKSKVDAKIQLLTDQQAILDADDAVAHQKNDEELDYSEYEKAVFDETLTQAKKAVEVSELKYKNADAEIWAAYAKSTSKLRDYQENSSTILAPSAGVISDVTLSSGSVISANSTTSNTSGATIVSAQTIGKISNPNGQLIASVNLPEMDIINIKANQKALLTLDAFPDKSFTGKVLAVNTSGSISSGVTSYPVTILLDPTSLDIYPNMSVNVEIITRIKNEVILVPTVSITTVGGASTIQVKKDNIFTTVQVEVGESNDYQTEIISGINEGDEVVTAVITAGDNNQTNNTPSPFSGFGGTGGRSPRGF